MKRAILPALMIALLLSGCAGGPEERIENKRGALAEAGSFSFTARVTADLDTERFDCTLDVARTPEETRVTVVEPEEIAGVRAVLRDGKAALEYDDLSLSLGAGLRERTGPAEAMALLTEALRSGHVTRSWTERDGETRLAAAELYCTDALTWRIWYLEPDLTPLHAELLEDGRMILAAEIGEFLVNRES